MKKYLVILITAISVAFTSCSTEKIGAGEEGVLIKKPYFIGSNGVSQEPLKTGRHIVAWSSSVAIYDIKPIKYEERFDDVITLDNNPVDFIAYIQIEIQAGMTWKLHDTKGRQWYTNNVEDVFRAKIRGYCTKYEMFTLTTNRIVVDSLELVILKEMQEYTKEQSIPVNVKQIIIGKVTPPKAVIEETIKTAAQEQARKTQESRKRMEDARKDADHSKALADMEYKNTFTGMTVNQYLYLRSLEIESEKLEIVKNKKNVSINLIQGGNATPTLPLK